MFQLFTEDLPSPPKPSYMVRDYLQVVEAITKLKQYYKQSTFQVKNSHVLVKMIELLWSNYADEDDFIKDVKNASAGVGQVGISTRYRQGQILNDVFTGGMGKCLIYLDTDSLASAPPITCCYHPHTLVNLPILNGVMPAHDLGLNSLKVSTYVVNLNSIMLGYKHYRYYNSHHGSIAKYVHNYCLPEMMESFYHLSLWNRLFYGNNTPNGKATHPLTTPLLLQNANMGNYNSKAGMKGSQFPTYTSILQWPKRRGYAHHSHLSLPNGCGIYRPTAAFAWVSRAPIIYGLINLGGKDLYNLEQDHLRALELQWALTLSGKFVNLGFINTLVAKQMLAVNDALTKLKGN